MQKRGAQTASRLDASTITSKLNLPGSPTAIPALKPRGQLHGDLLGMSA